MIYDLYELAVVEPVTVALHDDIANHGAARSQRSNRDLAQTGADGSSCKLLHAAFVVALDRRVAELCDVQHLINSA